MTVRVQIGFDMTLTDPVNFMILDDPVQGALDDIYVLGGNTLVDVTDSVREVSTRRGRSQQLGTFTGAAQVVLNNMDRAFDPVNAASPYFGSIIPMKQLVIDDDGVPIWTGFVDDWNFDYAPNGISMATCAGIDGFVLFAPRTLDEGAQVAEPAGTRIDRVLDLLGWTASQRDVSVGQVALDADYVVAGTNALAYMQKAAGSDPGALFMSRAGVVTFRDRADQQQFSSSATFSDVSGSATIPFTAISVGYGAETLMNTASVSYVSGSVVAGVGESASAASQTLFGKKEQQYATLLGDALDATALAEWLVAQYASPRYTVSQLTVDLLALAATQQGIIRALELGDVVLVEWTPNNVGDPVSEYLVVNSIAHSVTASPRRHSVTIGTSKTSAAFILDDDHFGILDTSTLGF
jgi:hypothetical protein